MWIKSHLSLARHPKTLRLTRLIHVPAPAAIGHLHLLWWWCLEYADDGDLTKFHAEELALAAQYDGDANRFVDGLVEAGFLDREGDALLVHDWDEYTGRIQQRRKANTERMRQARAQHTTHTDIARGAHVQRTTSARASDVQGQRRGEEKRGEEREILVADAPPAKVTPIEKKRATKAPKHFDLDAEHYDLGETLGFTTQQTTDETNRFLDWHRAKGTSNVNWDAAWRNWMRKAKDIRDERAAKKGGRMTEAEYAAELDRAMGGGDVIEGTFS